MATIVGLSIALFGLLGVALLTRGTLGTFRRDHVRAVLGMVALTAALLALVTYWEERPLSSVGLVPPTLDGVMLGVGVAVAYVYLVGPELMRFMGLAGQPAYEAFVRETVRLPVWYRVVTAVILGSAESILYFGYGIERLGALTGSMVIACILAAMASVLTALLFWGRRSALLLFVAALISAALYAWWRDLTPLIIAQVAYDVVALVRQAPAREAEA